MAAVTGEIHTKTEATVAKWRGKGGGQFVVCLFLVLPALFYIEDCDFPGENESERYVKGGGALTSSIVTQTEKKNGTK